MVARHRLLVEADGAGQRLDAWIAAHRPELSRSRVQSLIEAGQILVDEKAPRPSSRVRTGQAVTIEVPAAIPAIPQPEDIPLAIVHEDDRLLVIDKPTGLAVHPGAGRPAGTLVNALLHHVKDLSGIGGVLRPGIVHRLDRGTSGLLVVAKDDASHRHLAHQFAARTVEKEYLAVVLGVPARAEGTIQAAIGRDPVHRQKMSIRSRHGRAAESAYSVLERLDGAALVRVRIHSGRTHQIRVHMASIGHPVAGDSVYGGTRTPSSKNPAARAALLGLGRPALHAARLAFTHPGTGERVIFASPLPADIERLLAALRSSLPQ
jgi:23S rRNA pseudouridine1911/1915/1917 synthase